MSPSYKEKLIKSEELLRGLINEKVLGDLRNSKATYVAETFIARSANLVSKVRLAADKYGLDLPEEITHPRYVNDWLTESARGINSLNKAEIVVDKMMALIDSLLEEREFISKLADKILDHSSVLNTALTDDLDPKETYISMSGVIEAIERPSSEGSSQ